MLLKGFNNPSTFKYDIHVNVGLASGHGNVTTSTSFPGQSQSSQRTLGTRLGQSCAFFWRYSGYSYSGLGITEYTEFQFRKERSWIWKRNTHGGGDLKTTSKRPRRISRHKRTRILSIPSKRYSIHSENGIAPKRTQIPSIPSISIPE